MYTYTYICIYIYTYICVYISSSYWYRIIHFSIWSVLGLYKSICIKNEMKTSLVAQWLRIRLPMQGSRVRSLVREDPTCRVATKPMRHNY